MLLISRCCLLGFTSASIAFAAVLPGLWKRPPSSSSIPQQHFVTTSANAPVERAGGRNVLTTIPVNSSWVEGNKERNKKLIKKGTSNNVGNDQGVSNSTEPPGYSFVFGPLDAATEAGAAKGYMGSLSLPTYNVTECASECNKRQPDKEGGLCQFFNIYTVGNTPPTYTCSMFYAVTNSSTARNRGAQMAKISDSRGYRRVSLVEDGGFEGYTCDDGSFFCHTNATSNWKGTSSPGGHTDASIFHYASYAHESDSVGLLGELNKEDNLPGTLEPTKPLETIPGREYTVAFFYWSGFGDPAAEKNAHVEVYWNDKAVGSITPKFPWWTFHSFQVKALGNDILKLVGGEAPAWSFIDDVVVFLNSP